MLCRADNRGRMDRPDDLQVTNVQQNAPTLSGYQASVLDLTAAIYGTVSQ